MAFPPITTAQRLHAERLMDYITAGPSLAEVYLQFHLTCSAYSALTTLDQMCGKITEEVATPGRRFKARRSVKVGGFHLRFLFEHDPYCDKKVWDPMSDRVYVQGFETSGSITNTCFSKPSGYISYLRFLERVIAIVPKKICALAMGQHAMLGSQSLLSQLPADLFQRMFQIRDGDDDDIRIETWSLEKEDELEFKRRHPYFEEIKQLIRELVASVPYQTTGGDDTIQVGTLDFDLRDQHDACVRLDQKFNWTTEEQPEDHMFYAERKITIGDLTVAFEFQYDKYYGPTFTRVIGLGEATGLLCSEAGCCSEAFDYLVTTLFDNRPRHLAARLTDGDDRVLAIV
jgi:hypothetical protein